MKIAKLTIPKAKEFVSNTYFEKIIQTEINSDDLWNENV